MARPEDGMDRDHVVELVLLAQRLTTAPEQELQQWADSEPLGALRDFPQRLQLAQATLEAWGMSLSTLAARLQNVVEAAARGRAAADEPQAAPAPSMGVSASSRERY